MIWMVILQRLVTWILHTDRCVNHKRTPWYTHKALCVSPDIDVHVRWWYHNPEMCKQVYVQMTLLIIQAVHQATTSTSTYSTKLRCQHVYPASSHDVNKCIIHQVTMSTSICSNKSRSQQVYTPPSQDVNKCILHQVTMFTNDSSINLLCQQVCK